MEALNLLARKSTAVLAAALFLALAGSAHAASVAVSITSVTPQSPVPGDTVTFQANSSPSVTYSWDYDYTGGSGHFVQGDATFSHQYTDRGAYTVVVYVTDGKGNSGYAYRRLLVGHQPTASFSWDPAAPAPGDTVTFTSTSSSPDPGGSIKSYAWDLNGDGKFDDGTNPTATKTFDSPGSYTVGLKVVDDLGYSSTHTETFNVATPQPQPQPTGSSGGFDTPAPAPDTSPPAPAPNPLNPNANLAQFNPKPFIRIKGHTTGRGAQLDLITVRAIRGAHVWVRCAGKRCPKHKTQAKTVKTSKKVATVRFRGIEGWFHAGTILEFRVTKKGYIGRYTRFRIGNVKPPVRWDACLMPGATGPKEC